MKKLTITLLFVLGVFVSMAQSEEFSNVEVLNSFILDGDSVRHTTKTGVADDTLVTMGYVNDNFINGGLEYDPHYAADSSFLNTGIREWDASVAKNIISEDTTNWAADLVYSNDSADIVWFKDLDEMRDSIRWMSDSIDAINDTLTYIVNSLKSSSYRVTLPANAALSAAATACTDFPDGWVVTAIGDDLYIDHGLQKYTSNISVKYNVSGDQYRLTRPFNNAYSGVIEPDNEHIVIEGYCTFYETAITEIKISF